MGTGRSSILTYHSLDRSGSVISIAPEAFQAQMVWLEESGAPVVPLEAVQATPGAVAITFDDGFRNFYEHAFPVLQRYRFPATVFVVSDFCGRRNDWPTQPRNSGIPLLDLMGWDELQEISRAGIVIGSHTATHPFLSRLSAGEISREISTSKAKIEDRLGKPAAAFAYPYGDFTPPVRAAVASQFGLACGTRLAFLSGGDDPLALPRLDMYYLQNPFWFRGLGSFRGKAYVGARGLVRGLRNRLP